MTFNVLIVDDSAVMRAMIRRTLGMSGLPVGEVHEAADGEQALAAVRDHWVDLMLLDVNMPVLDGEQTLERLRADEATRSMPVIVVSTEGSADRLAALRRHGVEFVHKPFAPEQLRDTILRMTGVSDEHAGEYADAHADAAAMDGVAAPRGDVDF